MTKQIQAAKWATLCIISLDCATPVLAQEVALEEIVVTARKRSESIQKVPISITAITADDLARHGVTQLRDALASVPNVLTENTGIDAPTIAIRGISSDVSTVSVEPGVGFYEDEVFLARPVLFNANLGDVNRVEVLRGPQGSLFGKNVVGGAVSVFTQDPKFDLGAEFSGLYGSRQLWQVRGVVNAPLIDDKLAVRIVGFHRQQDGFVKNLFPGSRALGAEDSYGLRGKLLFQPSSSVRDVLTVEYGKANNTPFGQDVNGGLLSSLGLDTNPNDRIVTQNSPNRDNLKTFGLTNRLEADLGIVNLVSISGYRSYTLDYETDVDASALDILAAGQAEKMNFFSQELRLSSNQTNKLSYILGGYFATQKVVGSTPLSFGSNFDDFFSGVGDIGPYSAVWTNDVRIRTNSYAAFLSSTYRFNDKLAFTGGLRYTIETRNLDISQTATENIPFLIPAGQIVSIPETQRSLTDRALSGDATLSWTPNRDTLVYLKYSRGFKGGGFDSNRTLDTTLAHIAFRKETADAYEIGLKFTGLNGTIRANITSFYLDYKNKQENLFDGVSFKTANAASAKIQGGELEITALPTKGLQFNFGVGYTDATYSKFIDPLAGTDVSGNDLLRAPRWTVTLSGDYKRSIGRNIGGYLHVDVQNKSRYFTDTANTPKFAAENRTTVNGRIGLSAGNDRYSFAIFGTNLFDTQKRIFASSVLGAFNTIGFNEPRTIGVEAGVKF